MPKIKNLLMLGVFQRPLTLILLQKYRDTNGRRIAIQIGGVYTTFCQKEGILLQKYRDRNGRCIAILFKSIGVRGRFDSPDLMPLFLRKGCFPADFQEGKRPIKTFGKKEGKRPGEEGKRPINANGQFSGYPNMVETGPSKKAHWCMRKPGTRVQKQMVQKQMERLKKT